RRNTSPPARLRTLLNETSVAVSSTSPHLRWPSRSVTWSACTPFAGYLATRSGRRRHSAQPRRVGRELRRLGVERRIVTQPRAKTGWDSLTDSELTVVNLIATGATNRSVAQQLHVSPHTVRAHLRNAFTKLGVSSRVELSQLVRE